MSDFNYQPLLGATPSIEPKVLTSKFGDGYEQRVGDGINITPEEWSLNFTNTAAIINEIYEFLKAKKSVDSFTWTPAGFSEITVVCRSWSRPVISYGIGSLSAKFEQVFE
jgi:phage-related protein